MTSDDPATQDQPNPACPSAAQIEEGKARFRARYLFWKQQQAAMEVRLAEGEELPREE